MVTTALVLGTLGGTALGCSAVRHTEASGSAAETLPKIDGHPVYPRPIPEAPAAVQATWWQLQRLLADRPPTPPSGLSAQARQRFAQDGLPAWLKNRTRALKELAARAEEVAHGEAADRLFVLLVLAHAYEATATALSGIDAETGRLIGPRLAPNLFARAIRKALPPLWSACQRLAQAAPPAVKGWALRCKEIDAQASMPRTDALTPPPKLPPQCDGETAYEDPDAPPPDLSHPLEFAVISAGPGVVWAGIPQPSLSEAGLDSVLEAVGAWLKAQNYAVLDAAEVQPDLALVAQRRWRPDGPQCAQPPPLPALISRRHPHLGMARVRMSCAKEGCYLTVRFDRAGTDHEAGLPDVASAELHGDPQDPEAWVDAARRLDHEARLAGAVAGAVAVGMLIRAAFRVIGHDDEDPWLRTVPTVQSLRRDLLQCLAEPGTSVLDVQLQVSPAGTPSSVQVEASLVDKEVGAEALKACVAKVLEGSAWPCPRSEAPTKVDFRLCMAR